MTRAPHRAPPELRAWRPSQVYRHKVGAATSRPAGAADRLIIGAFLVGIWLPMAGLCLGLDSAFVLDENRSLAACPSWSWDRAAMSAFPRLFESYFNDRFGFRKRLIKWLSIVKVEALGVSSNQAVIIGRAGWLFVGGTGAADYYRSSQPFSRAQLERWARMFQERHDWLARRGIRYLVTFAPDKFTIYPEFMPAAVNRVRERSRLDQLLAYLEKHTTVPVVDMRGALCQAKAQDQLYLRTDTHWNRRGAYVGYRRIVEALSAWFPELSPIPRSRFAPISHACKGDLAKMLGLEDRIGDVAHDLWPRTPLSARKVSATCRMPAEVHPDHLPFAMECDDPGLPRAVMFRDSYGIAMVPFLSEHFRRIVYAWKYTMDEELVGRERPDVVIQELVERSLMWNIPEFEDGDTPPITRVWDTDGPPAR